MYFLKLRNFMKIYQDVSRGEIYYTARKSAYVTKFDITLSDGRKIADMTMEGDYDTVPKEIHKALLNNYKAQAEKVLSLLDDKIYLAGKMKKESDRKTFWFIIIGAFLFYCCFLLISLGIKYVLRI